MTDFKQKSIASFWSTEYCHHCSITTLTYLRFGGIKCWYISLNTTGIWRVVCNQKLVDNHGTVGGGQRWPTAQKLLTFPALQLIATMFFGSWSRKYWTSLHRAIICSNCGALWSWNGYFATGPGKRHTSKSRSSQLWMDGMEEQMQIRYSNNCVMCESWA